MTRRLVIPALILLALGVIGASFAVPVDNRTRAWTHPTIWDPQTGQWVDACEPVRLLPDIQCIPPDRWLSIQWKDAPSLLSSGHVTTVMQTHSLEVSLALKDGSKAITAEPVIDDIKREIQKCGTNCSGIVFMTE